MLYYSRRDSSLSLSISLIPVHLSVFKQNHHHNTQTVSQSSSLSSPHLCSALLCSVFTSLFSSVFTFLKPRKVPPIPKLYKMAAFSYQQQNHNPFVLDFAFQNPKLSSALMEDSSFNFNFNPSIVNTNNLFPQFCSPEITSLDQSSNEPSSVTVNTVKKQSTDSSSAVDKLESGEQVTQTVNRMDKKRKNRSGSSSNSAISKVNQSIYQSQPPPLFFQF